MNTAVKFNKRGQEFLFWVLITLGFLISIGGFFVQFHSNQNTYLLHGLVAGGIDSLTDDWFANTQDPMPVFGFLVQITSRFLHPSIFYFFQFFIIGIYLYSLFNIVDHFFNLRRSKLTFFTFTSLCYLTNSYRFYNSTLVNPFTGLAGQSFEFNYFLPNGFGAFLFLSIFLFLKKKYVWSILSLCLAGYIHNGYLITGALLTSSYMVIEYLETKTIRKSILLGSLALILISPIVIFTLKANYPAGSAQIFEAARIMVHERIPHHTQVSVWWKYFETVKLILCLAALFLMRKIKIFPLLFIGFFVTFLPVAAVLIRPSNTISLLMIWRASVLLVPLSTALILGNLVSFLFIRFNDFFQSNQDGIKVGLILIALFLTIQGFQIQNFRVQKAANKPSTQLYAFIREAKTEDQVYLLPPRDIGLEGFRLETGIPVVVDWKSHPWNALEFLEWYHRIEVADSFYENLDNSACSMIPTLVKDYQITHIVIPSRQLLICDGISTIYHHGPYILYHIHPEN